MIIVLPVRSVCFITHNILLSCIQTLETEACIYYKNVHFQLVNMQFVSKDGSLLTEDVTIKDKEIRFDAPDHFSVMLDYKQVSVRTFCL